MQSLSDSIPTRSTTEIPRNLKGSDSDESLVTRVLDGEKDAFAVLVRRYNQRIYRVARSILRDEGEAEDVAQQAMVLAYQKLGQWRKTSTYSRWLTRIAANEAYSRLRKRKRALENQVTDTYSDDRDAGPEMALARQQVAARIELAVDDLPPEHRSVFVLRDVEELNTAETAAALEISEVSVRVRLHRARVKMREILTAELGSKTTEIFSFAGERCARVSAKVWKRIG